MFLTKLIILLLYCELKNCLERPCPEVLTIDITNGTRLGTTIINDNISYDENNYYMDNYTVYGCICNIEPCIRKCCGPDEIIVNETCESKRTSKIFIPLHQGTVRTDLELHHHFIHNMDCETGQILLTPDTVSSDRFYVQENGSILLPEFEIGQMRGPEHYCIENFESESAEMNNTLSVYLCLLDEEMGKEDTLEIMMSVINCYGMIISMPFLLATFIAYALLPDRNLHMKALMFYVINLLLAYLFLVIIQLSDTRFGNFMCSFLAYACIFFFLVSFFWMNVICIDIWFGFSGLRGFSGSKKAAENKRFLLYFAYAWGMPIVLVSIIAIIDAAVKSNTSIWKPSIGDGLCFLKKGYPELIYFYGPLALLVTVNIVLFAITACRIRNIKKETSMLKKGDSKRHSYENEKQAFNLYLKLLFAMGVNWSMEIISWAVLWGQGSDNANAAVWYLTDFCNATYGVFIFFIFVFKRSIWKLLKKRYYSFIGKPHLAHSLTMNNTTRVTSCSTANSSVHENPHGVNDTSTLTTEA